MRTVLFCFIKELIVWKRNIGCMCKIRFSSIKCISCWFFSLVHYPTHFYREIGWILQSKHVLYDRKCCSVYVCLSCCQYVCVLGFWDIFMMLYLDRRRPSSVYWKLLVLWCNLFSKFRIRDYRNSTIQR